MLANYYVIPTTQIPNLDWTYITDPTEDTLRKSVDQTKTYVNWEGDMPPEFVINSEVEGPYTKIQINDILETEEWTSKGD